MIKILVLGAGLVARPLIRYFLDETDFHVTVASDVVPRAQTLVAGHSQGSVVAIDAGNRDALSHLVESHDLTVSLLPAPLHPRVAACCVEKKKHLVTTSYVSEEMRALHEPAQNAGVLLLNETGLDPGLDHMSAMAIIHGIKSRGGNVLAFRSFCGGLPSPDDNDNPWGYKFSWSPRAALTCGKRPARYKLNGKTVNVDGSNLFFDCDHGMSVDGLGELEAYPNGDSLGYINLYGLEGIETMIRGTFRYPGWCETIQKVGEIGLLDESEIILPNETTYSQFTESLLESQGDGDLGARVAAKLDLHPHSNVIQRLGWLGLFGQDRVPRTEVETTRLDVLADRMGERMAYADGQRDMIVLRHEFLAKCANGQKEQLVSTLIEFGQATGDSAMARTVSLPAALAAQNIILGKFSCRGVQIPVLPEIYEPTLQALSERGITFMERRHVVTDPD